MKRFLIVGILIMTLLTACGGSEIQSTGQERDQVVTVYKSPT
jgi:ABC-type glycerol-3-phosphate transport system substrate-binding protein